MKCYGLVSFLGVSLAALLFLTQCSKKIPKEDPPPKPVLTKVSYDQLKDWKRDDLRGVYDAFLKSCQRLLTIPAERSFKPVGTYGDWHEPCKDLANLKNTDTKTLRSYFETTYQPYVVTDQNQNGGGLFTGYYEPLLYGSKVRTEVYQTPLHAVPDNLFTVDLGAWHEDLKGRKITGLIEDQKLVRVPERSAIAKEGLEKANILVWVNSPIDAFFLHIQGSGVVVLEDGTQMRVGYAGQNGHKYFAIGRELIDKGALTKENVSLQTIRKWMVENPDQAQNLMNLNPSYIFFRELQEDGSLGAQGVTLTTLRSLAVDKNLYSYGLPVWVDAEYPTKESTKALRRLMIAQDTGGAIRGVVRGDVFWGPGERAAFYAGKMKSKGQFWFLLPKAIPVN